MGLVYAENWASTFTLNADWQSTAYGGLDAPIAGYPYFAAAEAVKISTAAGSAGENVFAWSSGGGINAQSAGGAFLNFGALPGGEWDGNEGRITARVKFDAGYSVGALDTYPIVVAVGKHGGTGADAGLFNGDRAIWLEVEKASSFAMVLHYSVYGAANSVASSYAVTVDDAWHDVDLRWKCGTPLSSFTNASTNGYIEVRVDNTLVYNLQNLKLLMGASYTNILNGIWLGYFGMIGPYSAVAVYDSATVDSPPGESRPGYPLWQSGPIFGGGAGA